MFVSKKYINAQTSTIRERWKLAPQVTGIRSCHHLCVEDDQLTIMEWSPFKATIAVNRTQHCEDIAEDMVAETPSNSTRVALQHLSVREHVIVKYEREIYPGKIELVSGHGATVSVMCKSTGQGWRWPDE